jgi:hypothetical protein
MIATFIMSIVSAVLSCMALWPQCKQGLVVARDGFLWFALVATIVGLATLAWRQYGVVPGQVETPAFLQEPAQDYDYVDWQQPAPGLQTPRASLADR